MNPRKRQQRRTAAAAQGRIGDDERQGLAVLAQPQVAREPAAPRLALERAGKAFEQRRKQRVTSGLRQTADLAGESVAHAQPVALDLSVRLRLVEGAAGAQETLGGKHGKPRLRMRHPAPDQRIARCQPVVPPGRAQGTVDAVRRKAGQRGPPARELGRSFVAGKIGIGGCIEFHPGIGQPQAALGTGERTQPHRPGEARLAGARRDPAVEGRVAHSASAAGKLGCGRRHHARKTAFQLADPLCLDSDRPEVGFQQCPPIDELQIEIGQARRRTRVAEQYPVETAEAEFAVAQLAEQARPFEHDAADGGRSEAVAHVHGHALDRQVGQQRIADYHVAEHLPLRSDALDLVLGGEIVVLEHSGDDVVRDSLAREPRGGKRRHDQHQ